MKLPSFASEPLLTRTVVVGALGWLSATVLRTDPAMASWLGRNQGTVADAVMYLWPFVAAFLARRHVWPESKVVPLGDASSSGSGGIRITKGGSINVVASNGTVVAAIDRPASSLDGIVPPVLPEQALQILDPDGNVVHSDPPTDPPAVDGVMTMGS